MKARVKPAPKPARLRSYWFEVRTGSGSFLRGKASAEAKGYYLSGFRGRPCCVYTIKARTQEEAREIALGYHKEHVLTDRIFAVRLT